MSFKFDSGDVNVRPIKHQRCECGRNVTHEVVLDLRCVGISDVVLVEGCETCANEHADSIRAALPKTR